MSLTSTKFKIHKRMLMNGLQVLVKSSHHIPRVEAHLWYNVGSKDEQSGERGMAHLIEHMLFKGTKKFSEIDINLITQKITADANAFTSQDYTCYTIRMPSHVWKIGLEIFAECMQNARFDKDMLASELKAVIEELRMYREDFQGALFEQMLGSMFSGHPYQFPIIGSKFDLCDLNRDDLYQFYKKHYHPGNAVLVVTGDVKHDEIFAEAEKLFGDIPIPEHYSKQRYYIQDDLIARTTMLFRPTGSPWYSYAYKVPGLQDGKNHLLDIASLILATGKSSRLYQRMVNKEKVAIDVDCSVYDFFERGVLAIGVWPNKDITPDIIEAILDEELSKLMEYVVEDWEFHAAKKRTLVDFTSLLESSEKQAFVIGNSFLATGDVHFVDRYLDSIDKTTKKQLQAFFKEVFMISQQNKGYLLPMSKYDIKRLITLQAESEALERTVLQKHHRTTPIESGDYANTIKYMPPPAFSYPKPKTYTLKNGLEIITHHNPLVPQVVCILSFKASYLNESEKQSGGLNLLLQIITDSTKNYDADSFAKMLESEGIYLAAGGDSIIFRCLSADFEKALKILAHIIKEPTFNKQSVEKIKQQIMTDLDEFWESPIDFIDQIVKELVYQGHPYHKNPLGSKESIKKLSSKDLLALFNQFISPRDASLVLVGDFPDTAVEKIKHLFESWHGDEIPELQFPTLLTCTPQRLMFPLNRDQVVLGFVAPSIARTHSDYNALALLDTIVTGGSHSSPSSRLFQLRERSGLFYTIGGSLLYGAREEPGMTFIKTIISVDKVEEAKKMILHSIDEVGKHGISSDEFEMAKNLLIASSVELFESNVQIAQTFLFLKKLNLSFNLFDKQGEILSILKVDYVNEIAKRYCNKDLMSIVEIGRVKKTKKVLFKRRNQ